MTDRERKDLIKAFHNQKRKNNLEKHGDANLGLDQAVMIVNSFGKEVKPEETATEETDA